MAQAAGSGDGRADKIRGAGFDTPRSLRRQMLVIFDCDGVLVDSEPISNRALSDALTAAGCAMTIEETTGTFIGRSWPSCEAIVRERFGRVPEGLHSEYRRRMREAFEAELRPVPGIVAALDAIDAPTCVASSGPHAKMRHTLGLVGLYDRFADRIFSADDVAHGKPAPDLFLHAAASMGFAPADCTVVEDSPVGVQAAGAAGMRVLGYAGRTDPATLAAADAVFADMAELPALTGFAPRSA
jgi:HAD superfamily hydrolase (TIGR01509 family)